MKHIWKSAVIALVVFLTMSAVNAQNQSLAKAKPSKGKKYALVVGINDYPGSSMDLEGAVPDALNYQKMLINKFSFKVSDIAVLTDSQATREAILAGIAAISKKAVKGDLVVVSYSGHGTLFPDRLSPLVDETKETEVNLIFEDGSSYKVPKGFYDSAIVPFDVSYASKKAWGNLILDDELYEAFSRITGNGVNLVFISDSCHSGTLSKGEKKSVAKIRFVQPEIALGVTSIATLQAPIPAGQVKKTTPTITGNYISLTAARDSEVAMDGGGEGTLGGLFTLTLIDEINRSKNPINYERLMEIVAARVSRTSLELFGNNQNPQLDARFGDKKGRIFEPPTAK